jgi:hypothetical protein
MVPPKDVFALVTFIDSCAKKIMSGESLVEKLKKITHKKKRNDKEAYAQYRKGNTTPTNGYYRRTNKTCASSTFKHFKSITFTSMFTTFVYQVIVLLRMV